VLSILRNSCNVSKNTAITNASTVAKQWRAPQNVGLSRQKALVHNWGATKLDHDTLYRILSEEGSICVERPEQYLDFDLIDLYTLSRHCTNVGGIAMSLANVWTAFFPGHDPQQHNWHTAIYDAERTRDLLSKFLKILPALLKEMEMNEED
jgi:hypothetical protein